MKSLISFFVFIIITANSIFGQQGVGIEIIPPDSSAVLHVQSTTQGVLFPRMNTAQRNSILKPANGLDLWNTDESCLNYFDSSFQIWNCYCDLCKTVIINLTQNTYAIDFYEKYAKTNLAKKYLINILPGVVVSGNINFTAYYLPNIEVTIINRGTIAAYGGAGGKGTNEQGCFGRFDTAAAGNPGGR